MISILLATLIMSEKYQDYSMSDMVYLRSRYYSPRTGTFLSKDPWDGDANTPMSYNKWAYTNGNPVNILIQVEKIQIVRNGRLIFSPKSLIL
jgi:RHS repeat-associated protein